MRRAALLASSLVLAALPLQAQWSGAAELQLKNRYLFAGIPFAADEVTTVQVSASNGSLSLYGYSVFDHDAGEVTEADVWGDYYHQASPLLGVYVGAALYNFRIVGEWEPTYELYGGVVLGIPLTPSLYVARDFDLTEGTHATLGISHSIPVVEGGPSILLVATVDYNDEYYTEISGFSYADVGASVGVPLGPVTVTPFALVQRAIDDVFTDEEVFGIRASVSF